MGSSEVNASRIGLGLMGMTSFYPLTTMPTDEENVELIGQALDQGCNFFDSAFMYGNGANEKILGKVTFFLS